MPDVAEHIAELHVHLRQDLLHALNRAGRLEETISADDLALNAPASNCRYRQTPVRFALLSGEIVPQSCLNSSMLPV
jgi:hypothetical protein